MGVPIYKADECTDIATLGSRPAPEFSDCSSSKKTPEWTTQNEQAKRLGEILASVGTEFYDNSEYECLFLR